MVISRRENHGEHLEFENYKFQRITMYKNLGVIINNNYNNHEEIKIRTTAANKWFYGLENIFKSKLVSLKLKITSNKVVINQFFYIHVRYGQQLKEMETK